MAKRFRIHREDSQHAVVDHGRKPPYLVGTFIERRDAVKKRDGLEKHFAKPTGTKGEK